MNVHKKRKLHHSAVRNHKGIIGFVALLLVGIIVLSITQPVFSLAAQMRLMGDVDNDNTITAMDARLILRASVDLENFTPIQKIIADTDKDDTVTAMDARFILRTSVDLEKVQSIEVEDETTDHTEHLWDAGKITKAATCATEGEKTFTCTVCGETKTEKIAKATNHKWDAGKVTKAATCAAEGVKTFTCSVCKTTKTEKIAKTTTHQWDAGKVTKAATCAAEGVKTFTCKICKATKTEKIVKTNSHKWDAGKVTKAATCAAEGVKTFTCSVCKTIKTEKIVKTNSHKWDAGKVTKAATCAAEGVKTFTCSVCKTTKTEKIAKTNSHNWDAGKVTKQATDNESGIITYTCSVCKATKTQVILPTGEHKWDAGVVTKEPTCAAEGEKTFTCSLCGQKITQSIPKTTNHKWNTGKVTKEASCAAEGVKTFTCSICNATRTETIEKTDDHKWDNGKVTKEATATETGIKTYTCSVCKSTRTEIIDMPEPTTIEEPTSEQEEPIQIPDGCFEITYYLYGGQDYLKSIGLENPNQAYYDPAKGLSLKNLSAEGYTFNGWYDSEGGDDSTRIKSIPKGTEGELELYAHWTPIQYTVSFDSPDVPFANQTYTVDVGLTLSHPTWFGYTFVGWSQDGKIVNRIPKGTTGNITLHANWTSNRNMGKLKALQDPAIIEDMDMGRYLFVYELGTIENVPLNQVEYIGNSEGITIDKQVTFSSSVNHSFAEKAEQTAANASTKTSGWTLSEDWNDVISVENEQDNEIGRTQGYTDEYGKVVGSNYYVSDSTGGATSSTSSAGGSSSNSSKVTQGVSTGLSGSYTNQHGTETSVGLNISSSHSDSHTHTHERSNGVNIGFNLGKTPSKDKGGWGGGIDVGYHQDQKITDTDVKSNSVTAGVNMEYAVTDMNSSTIAGSRNVSVGAESSNSSEAHWDTSSTNSSSWNKTSGYESSSEVSQSSSISSAVSEVVKSKFGVTSTREDGGSHSTTGEDKNTVEYKNAYSSTVEYSTETAKQETTRFTYTSSATGYYRLVTAGTMHIYAVVAYNIATNSYFTYTYNVLDSERHIYLDYSKDNANFNDCENAILPFEVPYEVHQFVSCALAKSSGLQINAETGIVQNYTGNADYVVIPEYYSVNNGDGTYSAVRVRGISSTAFQGKNIVGIAMPKYISEIPANAFANCAKLETVIGYGITAIGSGAFKNCVSLAKFNVDDKVTTLGNNVFENVPEVDITANSSAIAEAAFTCGAKRLTVNLSNLTDVFENKTVLIDSAYSYFALIGNGSVYSNVQVKSQAAETYISNMIFKNNTGTPLDIDSDTVTLGRITVENAPGFALVLKNNAVLKLFQTIALSSAGDNAVLGKNVNLQLQNQEVVGTLKLKGDYLICGEITNGSLLSFETGRMIPISEAEFMNYNSPVTVTFNANGGALDSAATATVYYGQKYSNLPVATRRNYNFDGWFTAAEGGTLVTTDTVMRTFEAHTLYAHWSIKTLSANLNANGGSVYPAYVTLTVGEPFGELPTPTREYYTFNGWYTAANGGTRVTENTIVDSGSDVSLFAHWSLTPYTVSWKPGTGYTISVRRTYSPYQGASIGALSNGSAVYYGDTLEVSYTKADYYHITTNGSTSVTVTGDIGSNTIYASAELNVLSDWATSVPDGAQTVNTKTQYRYRNKETTERTSSSLSGWTRTGSRVEYGSWSGWSDWCEGSSSGSNTRDVQTATVYGYYYFQCPNCGKRWHGWGFNCFTWDGGCGTYVPEGSWHQMWSNVSWDAAGCQNFAKTGKYVTYYWGDRWFRYNDGGTPRAGYRYRTRSATTWYSYERWGSWSNWSDSYTAGQDEETRTVYRYRVK
ncbi:MAG: InlB B-repeat-containing protein [Clostridia bacterium]|nr:InlB B-repeat-containing protein [Clostridia bacterium]